jgi:hypothetical protein
MPDAVAAFDLDNRKLHAPAPALASSYVVDVTGADRRSLAVQAVFPQIRAQIGHKRIIDCGSPRIKSGRTLSRTRAVIPLFCTPPSAPIVLPAYDRVAGIKLTPDCGHDS